MNSQHTSEIRILSTQSRQKYFIASVYGAELKIQEILFGFDETVFYKKIVLNIGMTDEMHAVDMRDESDYRTKLESYLCDTPYCISSVDVYYPFNQATVYIERKDKNPISNDIVNGLDTEFMLINSDFDVNSHIKYKLSSSLIRYLQLIHPRTINTNSFLINFKNNFHSYIQSEYSAFHKRQAAESLNRCITYFDTIDEHRFDHELMKVSNLDDIPGYIFDNFVEQDEYSYIKSKESLANILQDGELGKIYYKCKLFFEKMLYRCSPEQKKNIDNIAKCAKIIAKGSLQNNSLFSKTPAEVNIYIASLTSDNDIHDSETSLKIAKHYYIMPGLK